MAVWIPPWLKIHLQVSEGKFRIRVDRESFVDEAVPVIIIATVDRMVGDRNSPKHRLNYFYLYTHGIYILSPYLQL